MKAWFLAWVWGFVCLATSETLLAEDAVEPSLIPVLQAAAADPDDVAKFDQLVVLAQERADELYGLLSGHFWKNPLESGWYHTSVGHQDPWVPLAAGQIQNNVLYRSQGGNAVRPLMVMLPWTTAITQNLMREAEAFARLGYDSVVVPARQVGKGWGASEEEHQDVLQTLRRVLLLAPIDPDRVYMTGFSRGGHGSWDVGLRQTGRFAAIFPRAGTMVHTGGYVRTGGVFLENAHDLPVMVAWGMKDAEAIAEGNDEAVRRLTKWKYTVNPVRHVDRAHERVTTVADMHAFASAHSRKAFPERLVKVANTPWDARHYWLEIARRLGEPWSEKEKLRLSAKTPPAPGIATRRVVWRTVAKRMCRIEAVRKGNKFQIKTKRVKRLRLLWNREIIDESKPVVVKAKGRELFRSHVTRNIAFTIQEFLRTGDGARLMDGEIVFDVK